MGFPTVTVTDQTYTATTVVKFVMPAGISVSDHLAVLFGWDGNTAPVLNDNPLGLSLVQNIAAGSQGISMYRKIAAGTESGVTLSFTLANNESILRLMVFKNATGGIEFATALSSSVSTKSMSLVTVTPSWGANKDTVYIAGVLTGYNSASPTVQTFPAAYGSRRSLATNFEALGGVSFTTVEASRSDTTTSPGGEWGIETAGSLLPFAFAVQGVSAATGISIVSVSTDNVVSSEEADAAVVGTGLSAGTAVTIKGIACTVLSASGSTSLKITLPDFVANNIKVGVQNTMLFDGTGTFSVSCLPKAGWTFTVIGTPDSSATANLAYGQSPSLATSDMAIFQTNAYRNGVTLTATITVSTDSSVVIATDPGDSASLSFSYFFWDESTSAYGSTAVYRVNISSSVAATTDHNIWHWFTSQGYSGSITEQAKLYLEAQGFTGAINYAMFYWLRSLGYSGGLTEMITTFERTYTRRYG